MKKLLFILAMSMVFQTSIQAQHKKTPKNSKAKVTKEEKAKAKKDKGGIQTVIAFKPQIFQKVYEAGKSYTEQIQVTNTSDTDKEVQLKVIPFSINSSGQMMRDDEKSKKKASDLEGVWQLPFLGEGIVLSADSVILKPKETKSIPMTFKIPADAKGTYYFQYTANANYDKLKKDGIKKTVLKQGAGLSLELVVYAVGSITIKDKNSLIIESSNNITYEKNILQVESILKNEGDVFVYRYTGEAIVLKDGNVVSRFFLNDLNRQNYFFPKTARKFMGNLAVKLEKGKYDVVLTYKDKNSEKIMSYKENLVVK